MKALKQHRFGTNPLEKELFESFVDSHDHGYDIDLIVFGSRPNSGMPSDYLSEREKEIVASTIQWLGSPVGQGFLRSVGFELTPPHNKD